MQNQQLLKRQDHELESDDAWDITMITDLGVGSMTAGEFVKKEEGSFFAFIKRIQGTRNLALRSTQGRCFPKYLWSIT